MSRGNSDSATTQTFGGGLHAHMDVPHVRRRSTTAPPPQWMNQESMPRTAFITGASSGLGLSLVKAFHNARYKVFASCTNPEESEGLTKYLSENGLRPAIPMRITDPESVEKAYKTTMDLTSSIDVFVNNAGILNVNNSPYDPVMEIGVDEMMRVYEVNVVGCLKVTQTFMPLVQASWRHPIIINISSPLGSLHLNHKGILAPYRCSKTALNMLTKTFALEMPSVIFLAVCPRRWNQIPSGSNLNRANPSSEVKQDRRYSRAVDFTPGDVLDESHFDETMEDTFEDDAAKIVQLAITAKKEHSGSFLYTDGEMMPF